MTAQIAIPFANGVPGRGAPPQWWPGSSDPVTGFDPSFDDDTRWTGAYEQDIASGVTMPEASTRALCWTDDSGQQYVYLAFEAGYAPEVTDDILFIGLATASGAALVLQIQFQESAPTPPPAAGTTQPDDSNPNAPGPQLWGPSGTGDTYVNVVAGVKTTSDTASRFTAALDGSVNVPAWVGQTLSVWVDSTGDAAQFSAGPRWMIALRIPVNSNASAAINDDGGPPLGGGFSLWWEYDVNIAAEPPLMVPLTGSGPFVQDTNLTTVAPGGTIQFPALQNWSSCTFGASGASSDGVSLDAANIGTIACPSSQIQFVAPPGTQPENYFYAAPTFNSSSATASIPQGAITAAFHLADWGSVSASAGWKLIGTATNSGVIPAGQTATIPPLTPLPPTAGSYTCSLLTWDASQAVPGSNPPTSWAQEITSGTLDSHECMLVDLKSNASNIVFANDSVVRNMDFVIGSTFSRDATIDVRGLTPFSSQPRDVYLALQIYNMSQETIQPPIQYSVDMVEVLLRGKGQGRRVTSFLFDGTGAQMLQRARAILGNRPLPPGVIDSILPSWRLHCYHDTGRRISRGGKEVVVLGLSTAFGYFPVHVGSISAWNWRVDGATRIGEFLWVVPVPNHGSAKVKTTIQAQSPGEVPIPPQPIEKGGGTSSKCGPPPKQLVAFLESVIEVASWLLCKIKNS
ncbi:MAG TPA: hypothetical protein VGM06_01345 [Polyangiaceae bacterium]|jgi:hypothetical protein